ncbi:MAG: flavin reductase family protein [Burkholderiaceae bacterium]|nr:flavin reductase family protein [Burkholderiaceae bacterium]
MHYDATERRPDTFRHDPIKALIVPRPIGWVSTLSASGELNVAPYSFFNGLSDRPVYVYYAVSGRKDSLVNVEQTGEFTCSLATDALRAEMNLTSAAVANDVDEFTLAGLETAASRFVKPPRVARSPAALECRLWKTLEMPASTDRPQDRYTVVIGQVVGVYIDDAFIRDGMVDTRSMRPIARLGYMDYAIITPETMFTMNRPTVGADGRSASNDEGPWDGSYR